MSETLRANADYLPLATERESLPARLRRVTLPWRSRFYTTIPGKQLNEELGLRKYTPEEMSTLLDRVE